MFNSQMAVKKGINLGDLYPAVLSIILIGIALGVGIFVLDETADAISTQANVATFEQVTPTDAGVSVAAATNCGFHNFAVTAVANNSGTAIVAGNYTVNAGVGTITNTTSEFPTAWNVSYTNDQADTGLAGNPCTSLATTITGAGGLADWIAVLIVVIAAAVVLGIVINSFGRREGGV